MINIPIHIREICVFLAPFFSGLTAIATYLLTKELWSRRAGLFAAAFIAIAPGYSSRSVAGSYDNEGIKIQNIYFVKQLLFFKVSLSLLLCLPTFFGFVPLKLAAFFGHVAQLCHTFTWFVFVSFRTFHNIFRIILGFCMGWLCIYHQFNSCSCICITRTSSIFSSIICVLFNILYPWFDPFHANSIRWFSTSSYK